MKPLIGLLATSSLLLAGCTLAPHYERPALPVPSDWSSQQASPPQAGPRTAARDSALAWRGAFRDARLQALITLALANNRDLRVAALTVEQVRARYQVATLALFPMLDANGTMSRTRTAADDLKSGQQQTASHFSAAVAIPSYELDLFGRVQSLRTEALEQYLATEQARRSVELALVSQVAAQYLAERETSGELALAEHTLAALRASLRIAEREFQVGTASRLDLVTAQSQVQSAEASVAALKAQAAQATNALAFVVGQALPADLPAAAPLAESGLVAEVSPGVPSDLLWRRPDILQAEHLLKASNADVGAARAAFFPSISLTASAGTASPELSRLFAGGNNTWSFVPQINLPIFAGGRNRATLEVARLQKRIEIASYERAIQGAFREVADALAAREQADAQVQAYDKLVASSRLRLKLAEERFRGGVDSYLTVLSAQRDLYGAQQSQLRARYAKEANLVALYRALGGSWTDSPTKS